MDFRKSVYGGLFAPAMALAFMLGMPAHAAADVGSPFTSADYPLLVQGLGIGVAKTGDALKSSLDGTVCDLTADGTIAMLTQTWFGADLLVPRK